MRAAVYGRESDGKESSADDQITVSTKGCEDRDWTVTAIYSDLTSASRFRRKIRGKWNRLVADVEAGQFDVVVVWEPSRGDRDLETWVPFVAMCRRLGVLIHAHSHFRTYDPRNLRDWHSLMEDGLDAAYESEKTSARVRRGLATRAVAGRPHGRTTYGFERVYDSVTGDLLRQQLHPEHAPVVRSIVEDIAKGVPIAVIVRKLDAAGVPTPRPGKGGWLNSTVRAIGLNRAYVGKRVHHDDVHDAQWPGIVKPRVFERAGRVLGAPDRMRNAPGAAKYLLSCIATAPCGKTLSGSPARTRGHGARYACSAGGCVSILVADADPVIVDVVIARLARPDARSLLVADDGEADAANLEGDRLAERLEEFRESAMAVDGISAASLAKMERAIMPQIAAARDRARKAEHVAGLADMIDAAEQGEAQALEAWEGFAIPVRRGIVSALMTVQLLPTQRSITRWSSEEDRRASAWERLVVTPREPVSLPIARPARPARPAPRRTGRSAR